MQRSYRVTLATNTQKVISGAAVVFGSCIGLGFIILPVLSVTAWTSGVTIILLITLAAATRPASNTRKGGRSPWKEVGRRDHHSIAFRLAVCVFLGHY